MLLITQEDKLHRKHFDHSTQHMALLGNPGTGKTTAVSFMARFFHAVGITSRANVVLCDVARDFSDSRHVRDKFDEALGGVLFIDEAYRLAGTESLHQVVQIMTEDNYRDLVVIIAGYTDKMQDVFRDNPGISDRFKKQIRFENFTDGELEEIFMHSLRASNFHVPEDETESFRRSLYREFKKLRNDPHFANARTIKKFYEEVSSRRAIRCANDPNADRFSIVMDDLRSPIDKKENLDDILDELDRKFIGLQSVKNQIRDFALLIEDHVRDGSPLEKQMFNMQFRGNPGTGKTTIARYMARIYNALELIEGTEVIEMAALSLKGSYIGHSKDHVKKAFEDARTQHKLLFLDEAYALYPRMDHGTDSFAAEVIAMIVSEDTARYNENVFTILAGYTEDMEYLMKGNAGFSRRFCTIINFPDYTVEECIAILRNNLHKRNLQFDQDQLPAIERRLRIIIEDMQREPHFGNAGAMVTLGQQIIINLRKRDRSSSIITPVDLDNL